jgi:glycosyltransferase involved in cell wall biosynthesis
MLEGSVVMRIAYDGRPFSFGWIEGMLVYNKQLLGRLAGLFPDNQYHFYFNSIRSDFRGIHSRIGVENARTSVIRIPTVGSDRIDLKLFFDIFLPRALKRDGIDVFHGLRYFVPPARRYRVVTSFHDLFALTIPQYSPEASNRTRAQWYGRAVERSNMMISSSQATKNDLMKYYDVPDKKIRVVHLAPGDHFRPITDDAVKARCREKYGLSSPYILALGGPHPRKNLRGLIRAFAAARTRLRSEHQLVFFGGTADLADLHRDDIEKERVSGDVRFIYPVPDDDLPVIYSMADLFVYPSLYEGFGIPIVEAMSCGTPVVTSNVSSMPEVAADAALLVDPGQPEDICEKIVSVLDDPDLQRSLRQKGLERAKDFSWDKNARETMAVYREVVSG